MDVRTPNTTISSLATPPASGADEQPGSGDKPLSKWRLRQQALGAFLDSPRTHTIIVFLVLFDLTSVVFELVLSLFYSEDEQDKLDHPFLLLFSGLSDLILGIFVLEFFAKLVAFGPWFYLGNWLQFFDGFVTITSFILQLALRGIAEDVAALLITLRIWRVIDFLQAITEAVQEQFEPQIAALEEEKEKLQERYAELEQELRRKGEIDVTESTPLLGSATASAQPLKQQIRAFLESRQTQTVVLSLVIFDVLIVVFQLLISLFTSAEEEGHVYHPILVWMEWVSIGILALFMMEIGAKLHVFGKRRYTEDWLEAFDAIVIIASFALQLILHGIAEKTAGLLIVLRVWRVVRIIAAVGNAVEENFQLNVARLEEENKELEDKIAELVERLEGQGS
ncbi:hypothetical protein HK102_006919 [Quaeritorhiza haematococci]|nr:hypothetical protein HK102_006919 [Quaeritorhiza haematococci]